MVSLKSHTHIILLLIFLMFDITETSSEPVRRANQPRSFNWSFSNLIATFNSQSKGMWGQYPAHPVLSVILSLGKNQKHLLIWKRSGAFNRGPSWAWHFLWLMWTVCLVSTDWVNNALLLSKVGILHPWPLSRFLWFAASKSNQTTFSVFYFC